MGYRRWVRAGEVVLWEWAQYIQTTACFRQCSNPRGRMDNTTLFQAFLVLSYLGSLVILVLLALSGRRFRGAGLWIAAQALGATAPVMDLAQSILPEWFVAVVPNGIYLAALPLFFHSIWTFRWESAFPRWIYLWIPLVLLSFGAMVNAPVLTRTQSFELLLAVALIACGVVLIWQPPKAFRLRMGLAATSFFVLGVSSAAKIFVNFATPFFSGGPTLLPDDVSYTARYILLPAFLLFSYFILSHIQVDRAVAQFDDTGPGPGPIPKDVALPEGPLDDRIRHFKISAREWEVSRLVIEGLPSKEIADRLFISTGTVKTHLQRLFRKTGCQNRAELVRTLLVGKKALS